MDAAVKLVQTGRGRRRRWSAEQKLIVLQKWQTGIPIEEICRTYAMNAAQMYRWKRSLDQGLKDPGELMPKSHVLGLQKRVEELERALGRKALEVDVFKKSFELKGLRLPEGIEDGWRGSRNVRSSWLVGSWTSPGVGFTTDGRPGRDGR